MWITKNMNFWYSILSYYAYYYVKVTYYDSTHGIFSTTVFMKLQCSKCSKLATYWKGNKNFHDPQKTSLLFTGWLVSHQLLKYRCQLKKVFLLISDTFKLTSAIFPNLLYRKRTSKMQNFFLNADILSY